MTLYGLPVGWAAAFDPPPNVVAEVGITIFAKNIAIPSRSIYKEGLLAPSKFTQFGLRQSAIKDRVDESILVRAKCHDASATQIGNLEVKCRSLLVGYECDPTSSTKFISGSLAGVQNKRSEFKFKIFNAALSEGLPDNSNDISAQLSASSFRLFSAEGNKPPSDNCESASGNSSDGRGNPIKTFSDLPERDKGYVVAGAFFVAALIFIAIVYVCRENT